MTLSSLPFGISINAIVITAAALVNVVAVLVLYRAFSPSVLVGARARALARRRKELRAAALAGPRPKRRQASVNLMRRLVERLQLNRGDEARRTADRLATAGWRSSDAMTVFLVFRVACPPLFGLGLWLLTPLLMPTAGLITQLLAGAVGVAAGAYAPTVFVDNASKNRQQKIQRQLPDALDLFVICAEAGLGLDAAFVRVSREMSESSPELADELGLTAIELGFLPNRRDALAGLARRVNVQSMRGLVNTLSQTERYGTPLAQSLRVLANEFRGDRLMKAEEKAARLPATLTVPMILFILPPLFVILIGPAIIQVLDVVNRHH